MKSHISITFVNTPQEHTKILDGIAHYHPEVITYDAEMCARELYKNHSDFTDGEHTTLSGFIIKKSDAQNLSKLLDDDHLPYIETWDKLKQRLDSLDTDLMLVGNFDCDESFYNKVTLVYLDYKITNNPKFYLDLDGNFHLAYAKIFNDIHHIEQDTMAHGIIIHKDTLESFINEFEQELHQDIRDAVKSVNTPLIAFYSGDGTDNPRLMEF